MTSLALAPAGCSSDEGGPSSTADADTGGGAGDLTQDPAGDPAADTGAGDVGADATPDAGQDPTPDGVADTGSDADVGEDLATDASLDAPAEDVGLDLPDVSLDLPDVSLDLPDAESDADGSADTGGDVEDDGSTTETPLVLLTEVVSPDLFGALPRLVELTNCGTAAADLSDYSIGVFNDGGANLAGDTSTVLSGTLLVGESYVVAFEAAPETDLSTYQAFYGSAPDLYAAPLTNGHDAIVLFRADGNGTDGAATGDGSDATMVDAYGVVGVDGDGQVWDYANSHAVRRPGVGAATATFEPSEWAFGGVDALSGLDARTVAARTSPGNHECQLAVHHAGGLTVKAGSSGDLDDGTSGPSVAGDFSRDTAVVPEIVPENGATFAVMAAEPGYADCAVAPLAGTPLTDVDVVAGAWLCGRTRHGRLVALQVTGFPTGGDDIAVSYTTWESTAHYPIGVTVSGLTGTGLVLELEGAREIEIPSDGRYLFDAELAAGDAYSVRALAQPICPSQVADVAGATGLARDSFVDLDVQARDPHIRAFTGNTVTNPDTIYVTDDLQDLADGATATPGVLSMSNELGYPDGVAVDPVRDLLYVVTQGAGVEVYAGASTPSGEAEPVVTLTHAGHGAVEVDPRRDRLYADAVGDDGTIVIFDGASTLAADALPDAVLTPPAEGEESAPEITTLALDPLRDRLYVNVFWSQPSYHASIIAYADASSLTTGALPDAAIRWDTSTGPSWTQTLAVDPCSDRLYTGSNVPTPGGSYLLAFATASTLDGDIDFDHEEIAHFDHDSLIVGVQGDQLYSAPDGATAIRIWDDASGLFDVIPETPDRVVNGVLDGDSGLALIPY